MLVGLISTYKEGPTARHTVRTALQACDAVLIVEGPAGDPLTADVPPTSYVDDARIVRCDGRWRTDARKRTWMLHEAQRLWPEARWGLWLDGDEILANAEYLPDWVEVAEQQGNERLPLRLVELDGSISLTLVKLVRIDLIREYTLSIANATTTEGTPVAAGNFHDTIGRYLAIDRERTRKLEVGYLYWPPGPAPLDPFIVHRPLLRHPARAGLRLNEQEASELARLGKNGT